MHAKRDGMESNKGHLLGSQQEEQTQDLSSDCCWPCLASPSPHPALGATSLEGKSDDKVGMKSPWEIIREKSHKVFPREKKSKYVSGKRY